MEHIFQCPLKTVLVLSFCATINGKLWHSYQFGSGVGNREELVISDLKLNENFDHGENMTSWKSITIGDKNYAVGYKESTVSLITTSLSGDNNFQFSSVDKEQEENVKDIVLMARWNPTFQNYEPVLIVATGTNFITHLKWISIGKINNEEEILWNWKLDGKIHHLDYIEIHGTTKLLTITSHQSGETYLNIYDFTLDSLEPDFWLSQHIKLNHPTKSVTITALYGTIFVSIAQNKANKVYVYEYKEGHFISYQNITATGISSLSSFRIGSKAFLTIGGNHSAIYKFTKEGLFKEFIPLFNEEQIQFWFPVPVKTYRDEVLLILQRRLYHSNSHDSLSFEALVFNGRYFSFHDEMTCLYYGEELRGLSCLDEKGDEGIAGATVLSVGNKIGILIPKISGKSELFEIDVQLKELPSPVDVEVEKLKSVRDKMEQLMSRFRVQEEPNHYDIKPKSRSDTDEFESMDSSTVNNNHQSFFDDHLKNNNTNQKTEEELDFDNMEIQLGEMSKMINEIEVKLKNVITLDQEVIRIKEIIFNGSVEVFGESQAENVFLNKINSEPAHAAFNDIVSSENIGPISGPKAFSNVEVKNISFNFINNMDAKNLAYNNGESIVLRGNVIFQNLVIVQRDMKIISKMVNDVNVEGSIISPNVTTNATMAFADLKLVDGLFTETINGEIISSVASENDMHYDNMHLNNLSVDYINGINFDRFIESLCFKNAPCEIDGSILIDGTIQVDKANINFLNNLKFPEEYVFKNTKETTKITGSKTFTDTVTVDRINIQDKINNIDPDFILTRSTNQSLPGKFTINTMKILEKLTVDGKINTPNEENLLTNPTLEFTNKTKSNIIFKELDVLGRIIILENYNDQLFQSILEDVIYEDDDEATIEALKTFPGGLTIGRGLNVKSQVINNIPLENFVTKNTEQDLSLSKFNGDVEINNLRIFGLYGSLNFSKMSQEAVRLSGDQFISSELIFENENPNFIDLVADEVEVTNFLNGNSADLVMEEEITVVDLIDSDVDISVETIEVKGSFESGTFNFDLENLDKNRLSLTKDQTINVNFTVNKSNVDILEAAFVNNMPYDQLFDPTRYTDFVAEQLANGNLLVEELEVDEFDTRNINNVDLDISMIGKVFVVKNISIGSVLDITKDALFKNINIKNFNGVPFKTFANNIVYKNEEIVTIDGTKTFTNGFNIEEKIYSDQINDIPIDEILTKSDQQNISGPIHIYGNVLVTNDCEIGTTLNNVSLEYLKKAFKIHDGVYIIHDDVTFETETFINHLYVKGTINNVRFDDMVNDLGQTSENLKTLANVTFTNTVHINGSLTVIDLINNLDLFELLDNMVFKNSNAEISGSVIFKEPVEIRDTLYSDQNLDSRFVSNVDLEKWKTDAVYINRDVLPGHISLDEVFLKGDLSVKYINNSKMEKLVLTKTDEHIPVDFEVQEVSLVHDVVVDGLVNGRNLQEEYQDSLLISGDEDITSPYIFHGAVSVLNNLEIVKPIDGQNLNKIVTIHTDQNLTGSYVFADDVVISSKFTTNDLVNDFSFDEWNKLTLKKYQNSTQNVREELVVADEVKFESNVEGNGLISGIDIPKIAREFEYMKETMMNKKFEIAEASRNVCKDVNYLLSASRTQIYFFKYFEQLGTMRMYAEIHKVHHFMHSNEHYILISEKYSCMSEVFKWENSEFVPTIRIETGIVDTVVSIFDFDHDSLLLVMNMEDEYACGSRGTNVWKFQNDQLTLIHSLPKHVHIQRSLRPRTFYGLTSEAYEVVEYHFVGKANDLRILTKWRGTWSNETEGVAFLPWGIGTGLALYDKKILYRLLRSSTTSPSELYQYDYEAIEIGTVMVQENCCLAPAGQNVDIEMVHVGYDYSKRTMVAVASHEDTSVKGKLDIIKIYEDILKGKVFHKIPTYKPSSLVTMEFGNNGESLLMFLENQEILQVYEYKGIEGFQNKISKPMKGKELVHFSTTINEYTEKKILLVIGDHKIEILEAVTEGNQLQQPDINC